MPDRPDLARLLADPATVAAVPVADVPELLAAVAVERERVATVERLLVTRVAIERPGATAPDRLLVLQEAAQRLAVTKDWLRRRPTLPFVVKLSDGVVRYSERALARYIEATRAK